MSPPKLAIVCVPQFSLYPLEDHSQLIDMRVLRDIKRPATKESGGHKILSSHVRALSMTMGMDPRCSNALRCAGDPQKHSRQQFVVLISKSMSSDPLSCKSVTSQSQMMLIRLSTVSVFKRRLQESSSSVLQAPFVVRSWNSDGHQLPFPC